LGKKQNTGKDFKLFIPFELHLDAPDQRSLFSCDFGAPIQLDKNRQIVFVRVRQAPGISAQFYVHEVFTEDEIKNAEALPKVLSNRPNRGLQAPMAKSGKQGNPSDLYRSLIKNAMNVKDDSQSFNQGKLEEVKSKNPKLQIFRKKRDISNDTRFMDMWNSASIVTERRVKFRPFESMAKDAVAFQEKIRAQFQKEPTGYSRP
jgi:hypothetical protein